MSERELCVYSDSIKNAIESIPDDFAYLSEEALRKRVNPSIKYYELKRAFWEEVMLAQERGIKMRTWRVYDGKFTKSYFYNNILKNYQTMAWIMTPLVEYQDKTKAALDKVTERYDELISMEITSTKRIKDPDAEGGYRIVEETDAKKALVLLQTIKNLEDRVQGSAIQRQVQVHTNKPSGRGDETSTLDMDKVNERLKELEHQLNPYQEREEDDGGGDDTSDGVLETTARHIDKQVDGA